MKEETMIQPRNDTTTNRPDTTPDRETDFRGRSIGFYHPNGRGTGSALRLEPRISRNDGERYNCFFVEMAQQKTVGQQAKGEKTPATFDWSNKITAKLGFLDIAELLAVMEGRLPSAGGERNGLYHASGAGNTIISFSRSEQSGTWFFSLSNKKSGAAQAQRIGIGLNESELVGLRCLLQAGLFYITFPSLIRESFAPRTGGGMSWRRTQEREERT